MTKPAPASGNGSRPGGPPPRDDTTRYLCAAAHLDPNYANQAIREFLNEKTRAVPPSPGVDAAAVLTEAVAARTRRKLRDVALIGLAIVFLIVAPSTLAIGWLVLALVITALGFVTSSLERLAPKWVIILLLVLAFVLIVEVVFGWGTLLSALFGSSSSGYSGLSEPGPPKAPGQTIGSVLIVLLMLAVLLTDRFVVWKHLNERFWRNPLRQVILRREERQVFQFTRPRFLAQLDQYDDPRPTIAPARADGGESPGDSAPMIVYRGFKPFVGAGELEEPWSIAVPLEVLPDVDDPAELTTEDLYAGIAAEIDSLRRATALTPGRRLGELAITELVILSVDEVFDHLAEPSAADFLRDGSVAPYTMVRGERVQSIKLDPLEWARYYQCFRVETWDRDLVLSVFVHVAVGSGALYVEWTPCVLRPIRKLYQRIDQMSRSPIIPAAQSCFDLVKLPFSLLGRIAHTLSLIRPLPQDLGMINPDKYGVRTSLRELAADTDVHNYFQLADIERYVKMMESRLVLAVGRMMHDAGYSPASFDQQAATVINNSVQIGGSVTGNVVAGMGNRVGSVRFSARRPSGTK